jgi:hypothetical protein
MKPIFNAILFTLITGISLSANAQSTYAITADVSTSSFGSGPICTNCIIVISPGVTVTINNNASCNTCTFTGGTISVVSGSNFTLAGVDTFKNETVLLGASFNMSTLTFYNDTVAFNASMNLSGGRTDIDSSRVSVNAALTLNKGAIYKDSLHLNSNLSFTNSVDSFAFSHIDVASGVTISANQSRIINTDFNFAGSSSMNIINGMTSSGSNYFLGGTSTMTSSTTTLSGDTIAMTGSTNSFSTVNALTTGNTEFNLASTSSSTLSASSLTSSGGELNGTTGAMINITNSISLTNITTALTGATIKGNALTTSGGSIDLTNSNATITNADNLTNTDLIMSGTSAFTGNSASFTGDSVAVSGTASIAISNAFNLNNTKTYLYGNNPVSANSMSITNGSYMRIGDGTLINSAHLGISNSFSVDASSLLAIANNNNYLSTTNSSLKTNTISCGGGGTQHSCATGFVYGCATIRNNAGAGCITLALADMNLSASVAGPAKIELSWRDEATFGVDHYNVQRNTENNWTTIGAVNAGISATGEYHFTDADAPSGTVEYRLARIDQDGQTVYSPVTTVTLTHTNNTVSIHPNPAVGGNFVISTSSTAETIVNVFTMTGQLLLRTALKGQTQYPIHLPAQSLSLGSVVVQTIGQTGTSTTTVLVR